jgi:hypothetical protein
MGNETIDGKGMNQMGKSLTDVDGASLKRPWHDFRETEAGNKGSGSDGFLYS